MGHAYAHGKTFIYSTADKKKEKPDSSQLGRNNSKIKIRNQQMSAMKSWNHYDTNLQHQMNLEKKIIDSKNYEMDNRAASIQNYGY